MFTGDDYNQDLSLYESGHEVQKRMFGGEVSEQGTTFGWNSDEVILLFENSQDTQNIQETNMVTSPHETHATGSVYGKNWNTMSTVGNQDNMNMSFDNSQCHYLISTTVGGTYVTVNNG